MTTNKPPSTTKWRKVALISGSIIFGPVALAMIVAALSGPKINPPPYEQGGIHPSSAIVPNADGGRDFQFIGATWFNDPLFPYRSPV